MSNIFCYGWSLTIHGSLRNQRVSSCWYIIIGYCCVFLPNIIVYLNKKSFSTQFNIFPQPDTDSLHQFAPQRVLHRPMRDLCQEVDDNSNCYTTVKFQNMPQEVVNILPFVKQVEEQWAFDCHFKELCDRLGSHAINSLCLADFARDVVGAALREWEQIRADMVDGSVNFKSINILLAPLSDEQIRKELRLMHLDEDLAETRLRQIRGFFQLLQYQRATESIMDLRRTYSKQLSGDFDVLQKVAEMVC